MKIVASTLALALAAGLLASSAAAQNQAAQAAPSQADQDKAKALLAQAQTLQDQGDMAGAMRLAGEAALVVNNAEMMHQLGHMYEGIEAIPDRKAQSLRLFKLAAERDHPDSAGHYGQALVDGDGVARDHDAGVKMLLRARKLGYHKAYGALKAIAEQQKLAIECAVAMAKQRGYQPDETEDMVMGRATDWHVIRTGSGNGRRGDVLSLYGARSRGMSESDAYDDLSVSVHGFTGMETKEIPLSEGRVFRYEETTGYVDASAQGRKDADEILRACKR